jgi:Na+-driven multidrug efflux pump
MGGILNVILDPLFMFVLLPKGMEVTGAAAATALSNLFSCLYLVMVLRKASSRAPLSIHPKLAASLDGGNIRSVFSVGVPSALLTGLFDLANICVNIIASGHNDLVLAAMGIVMKVERVPNAVNVGICQGMLPIVAFNYASGNHERLRETIRTARNAGLAISFACIILFRLFAPQTVSIFLSTKTQDAAAAVQTIACAAVFLRIRCLASPVQMINYHTSFCMQSMGKGKETILHAYVRELIFYIPLMFILDGLFGENGLAAALPAAEALSAVFALFLLHRAVPSREAA